MFVLPERIFEAQFVLLLPDTLTIRTNGPGTQAQYPMTTISYTITNVYEETIQLPADLIGSVEIRISTRPEINSTVPVTNENIVPTTAIDRVTDVLTLNPGSSI